MHSCSFIRLCTSFQVFDALSVSSHAVCTVSHCHVSIRFHTVSIRFHTVSIRFHTISVRYHAMPVHLCTSRVCLFGITRYLSGITRYLCICALPILRVCTCDVVTRYLCICALPILRVCTCDVVTQYLCICARSVCVVRFHTLPVRCHMGHSLPAVRLRGGVCGVMTDMQLSLPFGLLSYTMDIVYVVQTHTWLYLSRGPLSHAVTYVLSRHIRGCICHVVRCHALPRHTRDSICHVIRNRCHI